MHYCTRIIGTVHEFPFFGFIFSIIYFLDNLYITLIIIYIINIELTIYNNKLIVIYVLKVFCISDVWYICKSIPDELLSFRTEFV